MNAPPNDRARAYLWRLGRPGVAAELFDVGLLRRHDVAAVLERIAARGVDTSTFAAALTEATPERDGDEGEDEDEDDSTTVEEVLRELAQTGR